MQMEIQINGQFEKAFFRDERTADTIFALKPRQPTGYENRYGNITCIGKILPYEAGMPLAVKGNWQQSDTYGQQLMLTGCRESSSDESASIVYLTSGKFSGISYAAAKELVMKLGCDIFSLAQNKDAGRRISVSVRKISAQSAEKLCKKIREIIYERELFEYLLRYGGTWIAVGRLLKTYGYEALEKLKTHPYDTGLGHGLDFKTCDRIGKETRVHPASTERLQAAIKTAMWRSSGRGHVYMPQREACRNFQDVIIKDGSFTEEIPNTLVTNAMTRHPDLVIERDFEDRIYLAALYEAETETAHHVRRLMDHARPLNYDDSLVFHAEHECGLTFAGQQRRCFDLLKRSGIAIITGGPGTGKTSCVSGLLAAYEKMYPKKAIQLCAPTGRAAQRLSESTGRDAVTIHRLLECRSLSHNHKLTSGTSLLDADLLVVDECSMLSIALASTLFSTVRSGALVLLIGDVNQLPSVEAGDVLHDLIYSGCVPVCRLREVHRQAAGSAIIRNAELINDGLFELDENDRFEILDSGNQLGIADNICDTVQKLYNPKQPFETQVLAPVYAKEAGVAALNKLLQATLNPKNGQPELRYGKKSFRIKDKVILLSNNYSLAYFNGDLGIVAEITNKYIAVELADRRVYLTMDLMEDIDLAYCISIHKSQGSEFTNVILALPNVRSLSRNLLYTGITRAKERVVLVAEYGAVFRAIQANGFGRRYSHLIQRITQAVSQCA